MAQQFINASEFIETLRAQGLVIVPLSDFELNKSLKRKRLLKKPALTLKEIVDHGVIPLTSKKGVMHWIDSGKIHPDEVIRPAAPKGAIKILTSALIRLGYGE